MSVMERKKLEEAAEHVRKVLTVLHCTSLHRTVQAEKYLKTAPLKLKFTPDWDPAGDEFSRAATCYKVSPVQHSCLQDAQKLCVCRLGRTTSSPRRACCGLWTATRRSTAYSRWSLQLWCGAVYRFVVQAGKMLEQAVLVSRDMDRLEDIAELAERGALMYRQVRQCAMQCC